MNAYLKEYFFYRQVDPQRGRASSKLHSTVNKENLKKVEVNAQVTAIVSLFEFLGNVSHLFLLIYLKGTSYISLFHAISLYHIVLPYSFLMNTSENKNRIIEKGWTIVFKNILGRPHGAGEFDDNYEEVNTVSKDNKDKQLNGSANSNENGTSISKQSGSNDQLFESEENSLPNVPSSDEPSCSNISSTQDSENQQGPVLQTLDVKTLVQKVNRHPLAKKQITEAIINVRDEKKYLENFKKLITLQEFCNGGMAVSQKCLENEFKVNKVLCDKRFPTPPTKKGKRYEKSISIPAKKSRYNKCRKESDCLVDKTILDRKVNERCQIRASILTKLNTSYDDEEKFESLIDELISHEENFIQNIEDN